MQTEPQNGFRKHIAPIAAAVGFLAVFVFFQFFYPYHLVRREQMNLFVFDADYIVQTYRGMGFLARFAADFLEQFFHLSVVGPLLMALLLTGIGVLAYRICRHFMGMWPSLAVAALLFAWSFMRETGNLFVTRYSVVTAGYLALILLALQMKKYWLKAVAAVVFLAFGVWAFGSPYHKHYGKLWGTPSLRYDRVIGLDIEVARENWDRVLALSEKDLYMVEASFCYNLAHAMKGDLGSKLFQHSQSGTNSLLMRIGIDKTAFTNSLASEAWYHLGNMTIAEQGAIIALQSAPDHTGARYVKRLAEVNLISGEDASAQKYLSLLSRTLFYGKWARRSMPGRQDDAVRAALGKARAHLPRTDFVHQSENPRALLLCQLEANPSNSLAHDYLLCYDLLSYDLNHFMEDYVPASDKARLYQEAVLIWLDQRGLVNEEEVSRFGVNPSNVDRLRRFYNNPNAFKDTYWFYYLKAVQNQR